MKIEILAALIFQFGAIAYLAAKAAKPAGAPGEAGLLFRFVWILPVGGLLFVVLGGGGDVRNPLIFEIGTILLVAALMERDARARAMDGWRRSYLACAAVALVLLWLGGRYELTRSASVISGVSLEFWLAAGIVLIVLPFIAYPFLRQPRTDGTSPAVTSVGGLMGNSASSVYMILPRFIIGAIIIGGIAVNGGNVVGRYVYLAPIIWAEEIMIYSMVWTVFAGAVLVTWDGRHLRMDLLSTSLSGTPRLMIGLFAILAFLTSVIIVALQDFHVFWKMVELDQRSVVAEIPMAIPHFALLFGFVLMGLAIVFRFRRHVYSDFESEVEGLIKDYEE